MQGLAKLCLFSVNNAHCIVFASSSTVLVSKRTLKQSLLQTEELNFLWWVVFRLFAFFKLNQSNWLGFLK